MPTIVVAENDAVIRVGIEAILEESGHEAIGLDNGEEVLHLLRERPDISILIASIELRGPMSGLELVFEAKRRHPDICLIVATGRSKQEAGELPSGALYLAKPFVQSEVEAAVKACLGRPDLIPEPKP